MNRRSALITLGIALAGCTGGSEDSEEPRFGGPTREDSNKVDVQWHDWTDNEIATKKEAAIEIGYSDLMRNIEERTGNTVHFSRTLVIQVLEAGPDDTYIIGLSLDAAGQEILYVSWVGERVVRGDIVKIWGHVLGSEQYQTGAGSQRTVPALSLVDLTVVQKS